MTSVLITTVAVVGLFITIIDAFQLARRPVNLLADKREPESLRF